MSAKQQEHIAHTNLTVLVTEDRTIMDAVLSRAEIRGLVWKRLDDTHALVDSTRVHQLVQRLKSIGHMPRFSDHLPT